jgi:TatA/E family protein of Tat protein translocase
MGFIGTTEIVLIGAGVLALIVGPKKLPQLARSLGESKKEYKQSMKEAEDAVPDTESEIEDLKS